MNLKLLKIFGIVLLIFALNSCKGGDARKNPPQPELRVKKNLEEGKGFRLNDALNKTLKGGVGTFDFTENVFSVYKVASRQDLSSGTQIYELQLISPETLRNNRTRISKSYTGLTSEIVEKGTIVIEDEWDFKPCKLYQPPDLKFNSFKHFSMTKNRNIVKEIHKPRFPKFWTKK